MPNETITKILKELGAIPKETKPTPPPLTPPPSPPPGSKQK